MVGGFSATVAILLGCLVVIGVALDPCRDYINIGHPRRSIASRLELPDEPLCDSHIIKDPDAWYRFIQYTGGKMPEECIDNGYCGTVSPIWMNGNHPTGEEVVEARACTNIGVPGDCCFESEPMFVRRCEVENEVYYVYQLPEIETCPRAYCAGDSEPCRRGTEWDPEQEACIALPTTPTTPAPTTTTTTPSTTTQTHLTTTDKGSSPTEHPDSEESRVGLILGLSFLCAVVGGSVVAGAFWLLFRKPKICSVDDSSKYQAPAKPTSPPPPYSPKEMFAEP